MANLEDVVRSCERRMRKLTGTLDKFLASKDQAADLLAVFQKDLDQLAQIPLPATLLRFAFQCLPADVITRHTKIRSDQDRRACVRCPC